jgi:hypothetical protein
LFEGFFDPDVSHIREFTGLNIAEKNRKQHARDKLAAHLLGNEGHSELVGTEYPYKMVIRGLIANAKRVIGSSLKVLIVAPLTIFSF